MEKLKVVEIFYSIQGEGRLSGKPSIFIRLFGCTLNCPGFGVLPSTLTNKLKEGVIEKREDYKNWEVEKIASDHKKGMYSSLKELPLAKTGCDSYCSWHSSFSDLCKDMYASEVVDEIIKIEKENANLGLENTEIVFTGGEPLLHQGFISNVCCELIMRGCFKPLNITIETNATVELQSVFKNNLFNKKVRVLFSISPKLKNSGCSASRAFKPGIAATYFESRKFGGDAYLKFVIDREDSSFKALTELKKYCFKVNEQIKNYFKDSEKADVYLMPAGGNFNDNYLKNCRVVVIKCLKEGFKYSPRLQVDLFKNEWGT